MSKRIILFTIFISMLASSCSNKCGTITCAESILPVAVGYNFNELDSVSVNYYTPNDSFNDLVYSNIISKEDTNQYNSPVPHWVNLDYSTYNDTTTTGDTLTYQNDQSGIPYSNYDVEIIVPSNNKSYRFSKFLFTGPASADRLCNQGGTVQVNGCSRTLVSYQLNGVTVYSHVQLYFQK